MRGDITSGPVRVRGIAEAMRALSSLEAKAKRRVVTKAVRAGTKEQKKAAQAEAPVDQGHLRKQLRVSVKRDRARGTVTGTVKLRRTKGQTRKGMKNRRQVLHLIVEGAAPHVIPGPLRIGNSGAVVSEVDHPGITPNPFMDRAARRSASAAVKLFTRTFGPALEAEARKGAR